MTQPTRPPVSEVIRRVGVASWSVLGTLLLLGVVLWILGHVANLIPAVVIAFAIIFVFNPVVTRLQRLGVPRLLGSCLSYLVFLGILILIGYLVWPTISSQAGELADDFPEIYNNVVDDTENFLDSFGFAVDIAQYEELEDAFRDFAADDDLVSRFATRITDFTLSVLEFMLLALFAPVLAFYVLLDLPRVRQHALELVPEANRNEVRAVGTRLGSAVGGFLRGQLFVALIVGVLTSVGFWLIDLPFWLLIGMIAGLLNIIPFVGPWVGGALGVLVALATRDAGTALWAAGVAAGVQQVDNHFISPTVLRATVRLHPAVILLALLAGGSLAGPWGVLLAVPSTAVVKILAGHLWRTRFLGQTWEEADAALIEEHPTGETLITRLRRLGDDDQEALEPPAGAPD